MRFRRYIILVISVSFIMAGGLPRTWAQARVDEQLYVLGLKAYQDGLWDLAAQQFEQYLAKYPEGPMAPQASFLQAETLFQKKQYTVAVDIYREFVKQYQDSRLLDKVLYRLGICNHKLGNYAAAETAYRQLLAKFPQSAFEQQVRLGLAEALYAQNKYQSANENYLQLIKQFPLHPNKDLVLYGLAMTSYKLTDYNQAVDYFRQLIVQFPESPVSKTARAALSQAYYRQGQSFYKKGEYKSALISYQQLLAGYPNDKLATSVVYNVGLCYLQINMPAKAKAVFKKFIADHPKHELVDKAWLKLGGIDFEGKAYAQAAQSYTRVITSSDKQVACEARYWLGECLAQQGQLDNALAEFLKVIAQCTTQFPWVNTARYQAAQIYVNQGKTLAAKKLLLKVAQESNDEKLAELAKQNLQQLLEATSRQNQ
jgi:TolA-binding protein